MLIFPNFVSLLGRKLKILLTRLFFLHGRKFSKSFPSLSRMLNEFSSGKLIRKAEYLLFNVLEFHWTIGGKIMVIRLNIDDVRSVVRDEIQRRSLQNKFA